MKKSLVLAMIAGAAAVPAAFAQTNDFGPLVPGTTVGISRADGQPMGGYDDRALVFSFDAVTGQGVGTFARSWLSDDFSFAPGPWAVTQGTTARINYSLGRVAGTGGGTLTTQAAVRVTFYDNFSAAGDGVTVNTGTVLGTFTSPVFNIAPGPGAYFTGLSTAFAATFLDAANGVDVELLDATLTRYPNPLPATCPVNVFTVSPLATGSTDVNLYRDLDNDGLNESTEATTGGQPRAGVFLSLEYDNVPPAPTTNGTLTAIDGTVNALNQTSDHGANEAEWYVIDTNAGNAFDSSLTFCDIDTEGSANGMNIALYDVNGDMVWSDADDGSGTNAQMSFGVGRRAAVGDGRQYDGRDWDHRPTNNFFGLPAGTYYLGVAPDGAVFTNGYNVSGPAGAGTFNVNVSASLTVAATGSVAPAGPNVFDAGTVSGLLAFPEFTGLAAYDTQIIKFTTCEAATDDGDPGSAGSYLDIDGQRSQDIFAEFFVFDAVGNLVSADGGSGPGNRPQLSFGDTSPARGAIGDGLPFDGIDGNLPAGTYYLYVAYDGYSQVPAIATDGRWHLKSVGGSNGWNYQADAIASWAACVAPCDGDVNCDFALDGFDVEVQEKAVGGDITDYCQADPDFNRDFALDGFDVEAVEVVVGGGPCP